MPAPVDGHLGLGRLLILALTLTGLVVSLAIATGLVQYTIPAGFDLRLFYDARLPAPYHAMIYGDPDGFFYSPAIAQGLSLVNWVPWDAFRVGRGIVNALLFAWLAGPMMLPLLLFWPPTPIELLSGNVNLLIAVGIVGSFRYPSLWAIPLLTKITPGIGMFWFAIRGEWRSFAVGAGVTGGIVITSFVIAPDLRWEWARLLAGNATVIPSIAIQIPFVYRLPVAVAILIWGARTDRPALVPIASLLALPVLWGGLPDVLAALRIWVIPPRLLRSGRSTRNGVGPASRATGQNDPTMPRPVPA